MTRNTRRKIIMNGKRSKLIVSAKIKERSERREVCLRRIAESSRTGVMNSSEMMVMRKMQPKTARVL